MTERWDPSIPEHKALAHEMALGYGIPEMRPVHKIRGALKTVGFQIEHEEDLAERPDAIPWYYRLEGDIFKAQSAWVFFMALLLTWFGKLITHVLHLLGFLRIIPKDAWKACVTLSTAAHTLVEAGKKKVSSMT
jgi:sterol 24-C-methyltransferase